MIFVVLLMLPKAMSAWLHRNKRYHRWRVRYSRFLVEMDRPHLIDIPASEPPRWRKLAHLYLLQIYQDFRFFAHASVYRLVTLASLPHTFYPLFFYPLYITVGPIFIGEIIPATRLKPGAHYSAAWGWFYLYGMWVEDHWLPLMDTWLFGLFDLVYIYGPLIVYLSFCITPPDQLYAPRPMPDETPTRTYFPPRHFRRQFPLHRRYYVRMMVFMAVLYQLVNVFFIRYPSLCLLCACS